MTATNTSVAYAPVFMFPQSSLEAIPAMQHIVYHSPAVGYWVVSDIVPALLTPEQRREWERSESETLGFDEMFESEPEPIPAFASVEDVIAWARAMDALSSIGEELHAFNAPSECGPLAYRAAEKRIVEIEARSVGLVPVEILAAQVN
jgi:hypothetical protein